MPIHAPGRRDHRNRALGKGGRNVVAMLSLTAMVDMFTVLAVFLLQNYQTSDEVIDVSDKVQLPMAKDVRELKPAHVIIVSKDGVAVDKDQVIAYAAVRAQTEWKLDPLLLRLQAEFKKAEELRKSSPLSALKPDDPEDEKKKMEDERRITVQADKSIDFLTVKKVMYTLTEAGASEVNFAVIKDGKKAN